MKKIFILSLSLLVVASLFIACNPRKRSRLAADTLVVRIDPPQLMNMLTNGETLQLASILTDPKGNAVDGQVRWSVDPETLGTFSDPAARNPIFTVADGVSGTGYINLECEGVKANPPLAIGVNMAVISIASVTVTASAASVTTGNSLTLTATVWNSDNTDATATTPITWTVSPDGVYGTFSAIGPNATFTANGASGLVTITAKAGSKVATRQISVNMATMKMIYNDLGFGDGIMRELGLFGQYGGTSSNMTTITGGGAPGDDLTYEKIYFSNSESYQGWFFVYGSGTFVPTPGNFVFIPTDITGFKKLVLYMKSDTPGAKVAIEFKCGSLPMLGTPPSGSTPASDNYGNLTNQRFRRYTTGGTSHTGVVNGNTYPTPPGSWSLQSITTTWQRYEIPIEDLLAAYGTYVVVAINIIFEKNPPYGGTMTAPEYIDIDYIRFED